MLDCESKKILVIEDNPNFLMVVERRLSAEGYIVFVAENGLTGLNLARKIKPDMIVLDLLLPSMDGHKVCRLIKFDKILKDIPVVILTSRNTDADEALARHARADAYLVKTIRPAVLIHMIEALLKKADEFETERIIFQGKELEIQRRKFKSVAVAAA